MNEYNLLTTAEEVDVLQKYIEENFTLDSAAKQLVRNILDYVVAQSEDFMMKMDLLSGLFDGVIDITPDEIKEVLS